VAAEHTIRSAQCHVFRWTSWFFK